MNCIRIPVIHIKAYKSAAVIICKNTHRVLLFKVISQNSIRQPAVLTVFSLGCDDVSGWQTEYVSPSIGHIQLDHFLQYPFIDCFILHAVPPRQGVYHNYERVSPGECMLYYIVL